MDDLEEIGDLERYIDETDTVLVFATESCTGIEFQPNVGRWLAAPG